MSTSGDVNRIIIILNVFRLLQTVADLVHTARCDDAACWCRIMGHIWKALVWYELESIPCLGTYAVSAAIAWN